MKRITFLVALASMTLAAPALAQSTPTLESALEGDPGWTTVSDIELRASAEAGVPEAEFEWGMRVMQALGPADNPGNAANPSEDIELINPNGFEAAKASLVWFKRACEQNLAPACNMLSIMYMDQPLLGEDDPLSSDDYTNMAISLGDLSAKTNWANRHIMSGNEEEAATALAYLNEVYEDPKFGFLATFGLAMAYTYGWGGVEVDSQTGFEYFKACSGTDMGNATCHFLYGRFLNSDWPGEKDQQEALRQFTIAAELGHAEAQWKVGMALLRDNPDLDTQVRAFEWVEKSALQGYHDGMASYAVMHAMGEGTAQDYDKAYEWYHRLAEAGGPIGMRGIGVMLIVGEGREPDPARGFSALSIAAALGADNAHNLMNIFNSRADQDTLNILHDKPRMQEEIQSWLETYPAINDAIADRQ